MAFRAFGVAMARINLGGLLGGDMGLHGGPEVSRGFLCPRGSGK